MKSLGMCAAMLKHFKNVFNRFLPENSHSQKWEKSTLRNQDRHFVKKEKPYFYLDLDTHLVLAEEKPYRYYKFYNVTSLPLTSGKWSSTYREWTNCSALSI